jgi:hypothetical protein
MGIKTYMWQVEKCKSVCSFKDSRVLCSTMVEIRRLTLYRPPSLPAWQRRVVLPNHYHKYHLHFYRDVKNYAGETGKLQVCSRDWMWLQFYTGKGCVMSDRSIYGVCWGAWCDMPQRNYHHTHAHNITQRGSSIPESGCGRSTSLTWRTFRRTDWHSCVFVLNLGQCVFFKGATHNFHNISAVIVEW